MPKVKDQLEDLGVDWRIILKLIGSEVVDWISLAHVRYKWRAVVNTVMNIHIP